MTSETLVTGWEASAPAADKPRQAVTMPAMVDPGGERRRWNLRLALTLLAAMACYAGIFLWVKPRLFHGNADFACFYRAGRMVLAGEGARIYDLAAEKVSDERWRSEFVQRGQDFHSLPFVFPPFSLALFAPLACLSYVKAELLWYVINVGLLFWIAFLLCGAQGIRGRPLPALLQLTPVFIPVDIALLQGQPAILLLLLFTLCYGWWRDGNEAACGAALALATIKPQFVVPLLLAVVWARRWRILAGFAATLMLLAGASCALSGWRTTLEFPQAVLHFAASPGIEHPGFMPNIRGLLCVLFGSLAAPASLKFAALALGVVMIPGAAVWLRRTFQSSLELSFSAMIALTCLTSYHSYLHDLSLLVLPFLLTAAYLATREWTWNRAVLAAAMAGIFLAPLAPTSFSQMVVALCGLQLVYVTALVVESRRASPVETRRAGTA
jgi:hypothetical protein